MSLGNITRRSPVGWLAACSMFGVAARLATVERTAT
jgi:hypothetical protein